jgi:hypothetical protein
MARLSQTYSAGLRFCNSHVTLPTTPVPPQEYRFRLFPVRSPLLGESRLISFPRATKMFQFARLPSHALFYSDMDDTALSVPGCPIRESPGPSLLAASRSSFVACYALHRLSVPRHPPCALCSLITQRDLLTRCFVASCFAM